MLAVLRDGAWHTRREIQERVGFFLTNNAASELRSRGLTVEQRRLQGNYEYRLPVLPPSPPSPPPPDGGQLPFWLDNDRWSRKA